MEVSLHFTIKGQTVKEIENKLFNFPLYQTMEGAYKLNHCFMPREEVKKRGFSEDLVEFLDTTFDYSHEWFQGMDTLKDQRDAMIQFIHDTNGLAIFVGNIIEGVKEEYDMAIEKGLNILIIK